MTISRVCTWVGSFVVLLAAGWFYFWSVGGPSGFQGAQRPDYYNLLVDGYQAGQLAMKVDVIPPAAPGALPQPALQDASYYNGKYYLYFGSTPALLLFWPWTAITGHDIGEETAVAVLACLALLLGAGWLGTLVRAWYPNLSPWWWIFSLVMLAVASAFPVVLRRPSFYEVAIFSGLACSFGGLWSLTVAWLRPGRDLGWLALASLCAGLAAGSRPTLIPGAVAAVGVAALCVVVRDYRRLGGLPGKRLALGSLATLGPIGACFGLIAWHNWARFGSISDFGLRHQVLVINSEFPFTLGFLLKNTVIYYLTPPTWSWLFPFFTPGIKPYGSYQEQVHGQTFLLPLLVLAVAGAWAAWRRREARTRMAAPIVWFGLIWSVVAYVVVAMAWAHANRYMLDFQPVFVVLALAGLFGCLQAGGVWRKLGWLVALSSPAILALNIFANFQVHGFLKITYPDAYARMAAAVDRAVWPVWRLLKPELGGVEVMVRFPDGKPGTQEPLVVAGGGPEKDALLIKYTAPGRGRIVYAHSGVTGAEGADFDLQPGRARWLQVHLGTLYPPAWHPWYTDKPEGLTRARDRVAVKLDGELVFERDTLCYQASPNQMALGEAYGYFLSESRFSGDIRRVRGLGPDLAWIESLRTARGALRLVVKLPRDRFGVIEPLLLTGGAGRFDVLVARYLAEGTVEFGLLHLAENKVRWSGPLACDYMKPAELTIYSSAFAPWAPRAPDASPGIDVEFGGEVVLAGSFEPYAYAPTEIYVGASPRPLGFSRDAFGGEVLRVERVREDEAPLRRARGAIMAGSAVELSLEFPAEETDLGLPLLTTGFTGRGDGVFLNYLPGGMAQVGVDHWGAQPLRSEPFPLSRGAVHRVRIELGHPLEGGDVHPGRVRVTIDGRGVLSTEAVLFSCKEDQVFFAANPIGMSTSQAEFPGRSFGVRAAPAKLTSP